MEKGVFIAPGARIAGNVTLGKNCGIWYNAVLRADEGFCAVGENTNIQDNCTVHAERDFPVFIGKNVTVGHGAIVHGCTVGDCCLIGMGAIIMNGAVIGEGSIIGAGALITGGKAIPAGSLVMGSPGKVIRSVTPEEKALILASAEEYIRFAAMAEEKP